MHRKRRTLSVEDQNAVDVLLDAGAGESRLARHAPAVPPLRLAAASKVLELLSKLSAVEPPKDLVARTMQRIDQHVAGQSGNRDTALVYLRRHRCIEFLQGKPTALP